ncbi:unnamed protein product [Protopolystoma xenopodis]|uniref:Uncharacterized protein n=1 Tax=Protopolystoma xenopodis TaxID=117903 RepID=A0A3S5BJ64_9PLAT|nr:unnamed protein product [Protopolystoma xenopodis]
MSDQSGRPGQGERTFLVCRSWSRSVPSAPAYLNASSRTAALVPSLRSRSGVVFSQVHFLMTSSLLRTFLVHLNTNLVCVSFINLTVDKLLQLHQNDFGFCPAKFSLRRIDWRLGSQNLARSNHLVYP